MLYAFLQFVYMFVTMIPTWFMFHDKTLNTYFLILITLIGIWNGGSYYKKILGKNSDANDEKKSE